MAYSNVMLDYTEARVLRNDSKALSIAFNHQDQFDWEGERPEGWDEGNDYEERHVHALIAAGRVTVDEDGHCSKPCV